MAAVFKVALSKPIMACSYRLRLKRALVIDLKLSGEHFLSKVFIAVEWGADHLILN